MLQRLRITLLALAVVSAVFAALVLTREIRHGERITSYEADYVVAADGSMTVVETVERTYIRPTRGVSRSYDATETLPLENLEVHVDGKLEPYVLLRTRDGSIGFGAGAHRVLIGKHRLEFSYRYPNAGLSFDDGHWVFDKQLIATQPVPIDRVRVRMRLPVPTDRAICSAGRSGRCSVTQKGPRDLVITASNVAPRAAVMLRAFLVTDRSSGTARSD